MLNINTNVCVFYHYPCHDGFLAQLVVKRLIGTYVNFTSIPLEHGKGQDWLSHVDGIQPGTNVLFVDIAPSPAMLEALDNNENVSSVNVWDHHIDYRKNYQGDWKEQLLPNFFNVTMEFLRYSEKTTLWFCNEISGSRLAPIASFWWSFDMRKVLLPDERDLIAANAATMYEHPIVVHASDYDTWTKAYPNTDAVFAYYRNYKYSEPARWEALLDRITSFDSPGYRDIVGKGEAMLEAIRTMVEKLAEGDTPRPIDITVPSGTYSGVIANAYGLLANDLAEVFREQYDYDFAIMYSLTPEAIKISIRSKPGIPANEIAQKWGGGGHQSSAGCGIVGDAARINWLKEFAFAQNETNK